MGDIVFLWRRAERRRKFQLGLVVMLMVLASLGEIISLGSVVPFLGVLLDPEKIFGSVYISPLVSVLGLKEPKGLIVPVVILFCVASILAGLLRILLLWAQTRFSHAIGADLSRTIFEQVINQPYSFHINANSSEVLSAVSIKADQVVAGVVRPLIVFMSSLLMIFVITGTLLLIDPIVMGGCILGFGSIYGVITVATKARLQSNGQDVAFKTTAALKIVQEGLGGIRDILIDGTQRVFCHQFQSIDRARRKLISQNDFLAQAPRYLVESLGLVLIAIVAYRFSVSDNGLLEVLPILGALAVGAQRILPLLQQSYSSWSKLRASLGVLDDVAVLLKTQTPEALIDQTDAKFDLEILLSDVSFRYSEECPDQIKSVNIRIEKGQKIGVIGKTGSGKSTFVDLIMGLLQPTKGELVVDGCAITNRNRKAWQKSLAHIPQFIFLSDTSVAENVAFGIPKNEIDYNRVTMALEVAQLKSTVEGWRDGYDTLVGERGVKLSGGQRQRIGIARAIYKQADVLILDEATSALDSATEQAVMEAIDELNENTTIIAVAHRLSTLKNFDLIIKLENGFLSTIGKPSKLNFGPECK